MKKLIFSSLVGLALVAFTGCSHGNDAEVGTKCSGTSKCDTAKKCDSASKCDGNKVATKCDSASSAVEKCGK